MSGPADYTQTDEWKSMSKERQAAMLERMAKMQQGKGAPQEKPVDLGLASNVDVMAGFFAQTIGDVEVAINLFKVLGTIENFKAFGQSIVAYAQKSIALEKFKPDEVRKIYKLQKTLVYDRMHADRTRNVPVTPFNFGEMLGGTPGVKTKSHENGTVTYIVGKGEYFVDFYDNIKAYGQACTVMNAAQGMEVNTIYHTYPYDGDAVIFCRLIALHYELIFADAGMKFALKPVRAPPNCSSEISEVGESLGKALHKAMDVYLDKYIPVESVSSNNPLAIIYGMVFDNKLKELYAELFDEITAARFTYFKKLEVFVGADIDTEYKIWEKNITEKNIDVDFTRYKEELRDSVQWRNQVRATDVDSHDWMVKGDYVHLPSKLWGVSHMIHLLLDLGKQGRLTNVEHVVLVGSRGANLAAALPYVEELKGWINTLKTKRIYARGKVEAVLGWNVIPYFDKTKVELPDSSSTSRILYLVSDFIETPTGVKPGDSAEIPRFEMVVKAMKGSDGFLVCGYNLMGTGVLSEIVNTVSQQNMGLDVWKHPRYNNDHIYLISETGKEVQKDVVRALFRWRLVSYSNTITKDECLWLGMQPTRPPGDDYNITSALFAALHVSELFKGEKKGVSRIYIGKDAHLIKILTGQVPPRSNNNNNAPPTGGKPAPEAGPQTGPRPASPTFGGGGGKAEESTGMEEEGINPTGPVTRSKMAVDPIKNVKRKTG